MFILIQSLRNISLITMFTYYFNVSFFSFSTRIYIVVKFAYQLLGRDPKQPGKMAITWYSNQTNHTLVNIQVRRLPVHYFMVHVFPKPSNDTLRSDRSSMTSGTTLPSSRERTILIMMFTTAHSVSVVVGRQTA